jgi:hypothetical protein
MSAVGIPIDSLPLGGLSFFDSFGTARGRSSESSNPRAVDCRTTGWRSPGSEIFGQHVPILSTQNVPEGRLRRRPDLSPTAGSVPPGGLAEDPPVWLSSKHRTS